MSILEIEFYLYHFEYNNDVISIFGQQKHLNLEIEPYDFLEILAISAWFSYKRFSLKKHCLLTLLEFHKVGMGVIFMCARVYDVALCGNTV